MKVAGMRGGHVSPVGDGSRDARCGWFFIVKRGVFEDKMASAAGVGDGKCRGVKRRL